MLLRRAALTLLLALAALPALAQDPSFQLVNNTGRTINEVYASPSSQSDWGRDRLGNDVLPNGRTRAMRLPSGECRWDVRVVLEGGQAEERRNLDLCNTQRLVFGNTAAPRGAARGGKGGAAASGPSGNPSFNLMNRSRAELREVYASPSTQDDWGTDRLGQETVSPGGTFAIRLPEGECVYDLRVVYADGRAEERRRVNLCEVTVMNFPDN